MARALPFFHFPTRPYLLIAWLAAWFLAVVSPSLAFNWETTTAGGRDYVTLRSFCDFYHFSYAPPHGNYFSTGNGVHRVGMQVGSTVLSLDGVHYVLSFPIESGDHDWLVSRLDVIKLFEPVLRPEQISDRHTIRGVVIDPGHGGTDNGASNSRGMEKHYALDTAFRLQRILKDERLGVVMTRSTDQFIELYERAHIASEYPDYLFVSIHYNCATPEARGLETYCVTPSGSASSSSGYLMHSDGQRMVGNNEDPLNILLASCVQSEIIKLNPGDSTADRGVKRARFVVIKQNALPAILVEGGFVSNRQEAAMIDTEDYRQRLAEAIGRGVLKFIALEGGHRFSFFSSGSEADQTTTTNPPIVHNSNEKADPIATPTPAQMVSSNDETEPNAPAPSVSTSPPVSAKKVQPVDKTQDQPKQNEPSVLP